jgi:hypothetical protein
MPDVDHLTLITPKHAEVAEPRRPARNWVLLATAATAILVIAGSAVTFLVRGWTDDQAAASNRPPAVTAPPTTPAAATSPSAAPSPAGLFAAANPAAVMTELTNRWTMTFTSKPEGFGTEQDGLAGDVTAKGRRLDAVIQTDQHGQLFDLTCRAGGESITAATDDTVRQFAYDCLSQAIQGPQWSGVSSWLDQHFAAAAAGPSGAATYTTKVLTLHLKGDGHVLTAELRDPTAAAAP